METASGLFSYLVGCGHHRQPDWFLESEQLLLTAKQ